MMKTPAFSLLLLFAFSAITLGAQERNAPNHSPTIVNIRTFSSADAADDKTEAPASDCLGFVVESDGIVLTGYQALINPDTEELRPVIKARKVGGNDGRKWWNASVIAVEPTLNFAILKMENGGKLEASKICPRENILPDMKVYAPAGFSGKGALLFNAGKITDLNSMECYQETMTATMLKAAIEIPDTSLGGPVFSGDGEVVAVHTGYTKREDEGQEHDEANASDGKIHILPIFLVFNIYEAVKLKGNTKSPWTGFSVRALTKEQQAAFPIGRFLGGVEIDHVWPDSPAEKLGIREQDKLVGFSYYPTKTVAAFQKWLYMYGVGYDVKLHFIRGEKEYFSVDYKIEERPKTAKPK